MAVPPRHPPSQARGTHTTGVCRPAPSPSATRVSLSPTTSRRRHALLQIQPAPGPAARTRAPLNPTRPRVERINHLTTSSTTPCTASFLVKHIENRFFGKTTYSCIANVFSTILPPDRGPIHTGRNRVQSSRSPTLSRRVQLSPGAPCSDTADSLLPAHGTPTGRPDPHDAVCSARTAASPLHLVRDSMF